MNNERKERQKEIVEEMLLLRASGWTNAAIAQHYGIKKSTVKRMIGGDSRARVIQGRSYTG